MSNTQSTEDITIPVESARLYSPPTVLCPTCGYQGPSYLGIYNFGEPLDGKYCQKCFAEWIRRTFPRVELV